MTCDSQMISIIVPIYNASNYLAECLESIRKQSYDQIEVLCYNDGSTDNSLAIMQEFEECDHRFRVLDKPNEGYGATCNRGLSEARGEWISIIEPDDWIEQDMFRDMLTFLDSFNGAVEIIKTPYWRIWLPDTAQQRKLNCYYRRQIRPTKQPFEIQDGKQLLKYHPSIWSALYRKDFLDHHNIRFKEAPGAGWVDNPFMIETLCQAKQIIYLDQPFYCYRENTPEQDLSFLRKNPLLPFERWQDMMDTIQHIGEIRPSVVCALNQRGFNYYNRVINAVNKDHPEVKSAAKKMFNRMDSSLVLTDIEISPADKQLFFRLTGQPEQQISKSGYIFNLISTSFYKLLNTGLMHGIALASERLRKRKNQQRRLK